MSTHVHAHMDKTLYKFIHPKSAVLSVSIWLFCLYLLPCRLVPIPPSPHSSIPCLLPQSSLPLTSLSCTLPHACLPHFFLSIHASGSLLIICDLLKCIHRFTLLFYPSCFLPSFTKGSLFHHRSCSPPPPSSISPSFSPLAAMHASQALPLVHGLGQRFTMAQFLHRKDKHCHSLSCPHSVIHGKHLFCSHQLKLDYCCESHNALQFDTAFHVTASQSSSETTVPDLATIHNTANLCSCALVLNERLQP